MPTILHAIKQKFVKSGGDRATAFAILVNATALATGPVTAMLVVSRFTSQIQGYYYTFGSLLALRFLADLGLSQVIIQLASHESVVSHGRGSAAIATAISSTPRLAELCSLAVKWYYIAVVVAIPTIWLVGSYLFYAETISTDTWLLPWTALCLVSGASLLLSPAFAILQGCGEVAPFWRYRLAQQMGSSLALWGGIAFGLQLWSAAFSASIALCWGIAYFLTQYLDTARAIFASTRISAHAALKAEVWRLQWRTCVTWMSTTFMGQSLVPVVFAINGPTDAGRIGLTVTLVTIVQSFALSWIVTKAPRFGTLVAAKETDTLKREFALAMRSCVSIAIVLSVLASVIIILIDYAYPAVASRLLAPLPASVMIFGSVGSAATAALGAFLRAHRIEPFAPVYLSTAGIVLSMALFLGSTLGVDGVAFGYLASILFVQLPWASLVFYRTTQFLNQNNDAT